ncbi:hypothetical protein C5B90_14205 [Haloferax sp. Atlit-12N]|nr:hypothetical protein C5B90_14205 [Haloferax sp. Atlit-12N]
MGRWRQGVRDAVRYVPQGDSIPNESWQARHRNILVFLVTHAPLLYLLGNFTGSDPYVTGATLTAAPAEHVLLGVGAVVGLALFAWLPWLPRRMRSGFASIGLLTCSALLVYFSGGYIEAHFHFFVIVAVLANEVKSLADETQNHSAAIEQTITETVEDVARVQAEMEQTKAQLETGESTTTDAAEAFAAVSEIVESVDMSVNEVATATDDGARTTEEVVDAIIGIADHSRDIAEQSDALASQAESRVATISEIREQLDELRGQTGGLQEELETFDCEVPSDD